MFKKIIITLSVSTLALVEAVLAQSGIADFQLELDNLRSRASEIGYNYYCTVALEPRDYVSHPNGIKILDCPPALPPESYSSYGGVVHERSDAIANSVDNGGSNDVCDLVNTNNNNVDVYFDSLQQAENALASAKRFLKSIEDVKAAREDYFKIYKHDNMVDLVGNHLRVSGNLILLATPIRLVALSRRLKSAVVASETLPTDYSTLYSILERAPFQSVLHAPISSAGYNFLKAYFPTETVRSLFVRIVQQIQANGTTATLAGVLARARKERDIYFAATKELSREISVGVTAVKAGGVVAGVNIVSQIMLDGQVFMQFPEFIDPFDITAEQALIGYKKSLTLYKAKMSLANSAFSNAKATLGALDAYTWVTKELPVKNKILYPSYFRCQ
jgi:hypothetical protein